MADTVIVDLEVKGTDKALEASEALEKLNDAVVKDTQEMGNLVNAMRKLKGSDEEVKAQATKLGEAFGSLKKRVAMNSAEYLKQGGALDRLGKAKKAETTEEAKATKATKSEGDAKKDTTKATEKGAKASDESAKKSIFASLKSTIYGAALKKLGLEQKKTTDGSMALSGGWKLAGGAAVGAAGMAIAATAALVGAGVAMTALTVSMADNARTTRIMNAAWMGSTQQGDALWSHIDKLAASTPLAREEINAMAISLKKQGFEGKALTELLRASAKAAGTLGADVSAKLTSIAERGRLTRRFMANALDFQGTGLRIDDVAKELSSNLKISMSEAKSAIQNGRVKIEDGMKAMADAMTKRVAPFEKDLMISLPNTAKRLKEVFADLFSGIKIEGILNLLSQMVNVFDKNTVTGKALKSLLSSIFGPLDDSAKKATPAVVEALQRCVLWALKLATVGFKIRNSFKQAFGDDTNDSITGVETALGGIVAVLALVGLAAAAAAAPFIAMGAAVNGLQNLGNKIGKWLKAIDLKAIGRDMITGFVDGIKAGIEDVRLAVTDVGSIAKDAIRKATDTHSPSRDFMKIGAWMGPGFAMGVKQGTPVVAKASENMGATAIAGAKRGVASASPRSPEEAASAVRGASMVGTQGAPSIVIQPGAVVIQGASLTEEQIERVLTRSLERAVISAGRM